MKLYYSKGACSLAPRIIINELGLPCEFISVNLGTKQTEGGENFLTINPKGAVPVIETNDKQILTENAVILQYLADTNKAEQLLPFVGNFKRYRVLEWVNYITTELHKGFGPLFNPKFPQEVKDQFTIPLIKHKLEIVDKNLEKNQYMCGDEFTLPDAYMFVILRWALHFKFNLKDYPNLSRYLSEVMVRKSIQKSLEEEGLGAPKAE